MATKTKTKTKLSKALKNTFISELKDKKEEERLERVKANADLKKLTICVKELKITIKLFLY